MNKKISNISQIILSIIVIIDVVFITSTIIFDVSNEFYQKIVLFDIITCILLLFDFFLQFFRADDKKQYFRKNWLELFASIPFDIILSPFIFLRYLRLIRLLRVLFLVSEYFELIGKFLKNTRLDEILAVCILIVVGATFGLYLIDPGMNNLFDNLWFVVVSLTTVGYGDITPHSVSGKIVSLVLLIVGVFIFSAITGAMSSYFMDKLLQEGSFRIHEIADKTIESDAKLDKINEELMENKKEINDLKKEIKELKEIIQKNN